MKKWMAVMIAAFIALIGTHSFAQENMSSTGSPYLYADGWLYRTAYLEGERQLVRSRSDGMDARRISRGYGSYSGFSLSGDSVFYLGTEKELGDFDTRTQIWAVNVDGQNDRPLTALDEPSATSELYRMPLDGSEKEPVERGAFTISKLEAGWAFGMRVSAGDPAFDSAWSLDYEDTFCMNLQTGKMLEMGRSRGPNSFYPAGDYLIFDAFDEGRSPLLISPEDESTQMLPEPVLPNF